MRTTDCADGNCDGCAAAPGGCSCSCHCPCSPTLPPALAAKVAEAIEKALPCFGPENGPKRDSCFADVDDHLADCPAKHRPAVRAACHRAMAAAFDEATGKSEFYCEHAARDAKAAAEELEK